MLILLWIQLIAAAILILISSKYLVTSSGKIATKLGLGHTFVGIVLLATATSLPELATGISSITLANAPDLAAGAAFGSNIVNLLIIAILQFYHLTRFLSKTFRILLHEGCDIFLRPFLVFSRF